MPWGGDQAALLARMPVASGPSPVLRLEQAGSQVPSASSSKFWKLLEGGKIEKRKRGWMERPDRCRTFWSRQGVPICFLLKAWRLHWATLGALGRDPLQAHSSLDPHPPLPPQAPASEEGDLACLCCLGNSTCRLALAEGSGRGGPCCCGSAVRRCSRLPGPHSPGPGVATRRGPLGVGEGRAQALDPSA